MSTLYLDLETTGLDPSYCQPIQVGLLWDPDGATPLPECPQTEFLIKWDRIQGEPYALRMNAALISRIANGEGVPPDDVMDQIVGFLQGALMADSPQRHPILDVSIALGGKNVVGFDLPFLDRFGVAKGGFEQCPNAGFDGVKHKVRFEYRVVDPGTLWMLPGDSVPPNLKTCLSRAGIDKAVAHTALEDCYDVANVVRIGLSRNQAALDAALGK